MKKLIPTPGRIVHYRTGIDDTPRPAVVMLAREDLSADLSVFTGVESKPVALFMDVAYDPHALANGTWRWPPREP